MYESMEELKLTHTLNIFPLIQTLVYVRISWVVCNPDGYDGQHPGAFHYT